MPSDYYYNWADNFFKKMTDLDSPRKNNDCYFYYYSTCSKGDNCTFRHEPSALGSETVCSFWKEGKCVNVHCNFRHMELRKNRKSIPCYWESQPGGCLKPHCSFMHQRASVKLNDGRTVVVAQDNNADSGNCHSDSSSNDSNKSCDSKLKTTTTTNTGIDSVVVKFEENLQLAN